MAKDPDLIQFEKLNRDQIRGFTCPQCWASSNQLCNAGARLRQASHLSRTKRYLEWLLQMDECARKDMALGWPNG